MPYIIKRDRDLELEILNSIANEEAEYEDIFHNGSNFEIEVMKRDIKEGNEVVGQEIVEACWKQIDEDGTEELIPIEEGSAITFNKQAYPKDGWMVILAGGAGLLYNGSAR